VFFIYPLFYTVNKIFPFASSEWLAENHAIFIASGDFYATTLANKLGINEKGGWIRAGLAPYNTEEEVDYFIDAIRSYIKIHQHVAEI
jgi:selenocysteine lyase/cysteine desulfurase